MTMTEPKTRTVTTYAFQFVSGKDWLITDPDSVVIDEVSVSFTKGGHKYLVRMDHVELYDVCKRQVPVKDDAAA